VSALLGSRKAKMWDHYVTVWQAKAGKREQGMLAVYMQLFAEAYDRSSSNLTRSSFFLWVCPVDL